MSLAADDRIGVPREAPGSPAVAFQGKGAGRAEKRIIGPPRGSCGATKTINPLICFEKSRIFQKIPGIEVPYARNDGPASSAGVIANEKVGAGGSTPPD